MGIWHSMRDASRSLAVAGSLVATACGTSPSLTSGASGADSPGGAQAKRSERVLAVTVDDLPWVGRLAPGGSPAEANRALLTALLERGVHATGFVVCKNAEAQSEVLEAWVASGMDLGNHTTHHLDLNQTDLSAWVDDLERCHELLSKFTQQPPRYFRFPMLHQGDTLDKRSGAAAAVKRLGYEVAHVTLDNSEWLLAEAYGRALASGDAELADGVARAYRAHLLGAIEHFDEVGRVELGRRPPHILLVHANALAADHIGEVLDEVQARGIRIVSLGEVLADPVFSLEDVYVGPKGLSWLYRTSPGAFERWGAWDDAEAARIRTSFLEVARPDFAPSRKLAE